MVLCDALRGWDGAGEGGMREREKDFSGGASGKEPAC